MIRKLNVIILAGAALGIGGLVVMMSQSVRTEGIEVAGKTITIYGQGYTLPRLAAEVAELAATTGKFEAKDVFTYDPERREGFSKASLVVRGSLQIGDPDDRQKGETLTLDTVVCGDLRLEVARRGRLGIYHTDIKTGSEELTADQCSRGYALIVDGTLEAADSRFLYMSGSRSETAREDATVDLERVIFALCDGCAFRTIKADGRKLKIRDSQFSCEGQFGFIVEGRGAAPIVLRRCQLSGTLGDLALRNGRGEVELVDCRFSPAKVKFYYRRGRVAVRWAVKAKVIEEGTGTPVAGATVMAQSSGQGPTETVTATTGPDGTCELVLTEYVATPDLPVPQEEENGVTPHRVVVRSAAGKVLAEQARYRAESRGRELTLTVPTRTVASNR